MATAPPDALPPAPQRRGRRALLLVAGALAALLAWFWQPLNARAELATSYGAHAGCACRHIAGRALDTCRGDFEPGMSLVTLSEDSEARSVTARFPLLSSQTATYRPGRGCLLERWED